MGGTTHGNSRYTGGSNMQTFDIGKAWTEAMAFLRDNLQMLAILVGAGTLIAAVAQYFIMGGETQAQLAAIMAAAQSGDLGQLARAGANQPGGSAGGLILLLVALIPSTANFAALRLGLAGGEDDIGSAIVYGLIATVLLFLAFVVIGIVAVIAIALPLGLLGVAGGGGGVGVIMLLLILPLLIAFIWLVCRLSVMQPAMAAARSTNPLFGITESWRMTRGSALMIFVYLLVIGIATFVINLIVAGLFGLVGGIFGVLMSSIIVAVPLAILNLSISAGMYRTLSDDPRADIFA
jgi:hypothetical protein